MKLSHLFTKTFSILLFSTLTQLTFADAIEHVTVINHSAVNLKPTAEGFAAGCVGGSMPPMLDPVTPDSVRNIDIVFIKYSSTCTFTVLPDPNITLSLEACHDVKADDVLLFTGTSTRDLKCQVIS